MTELKVAYVVKDPNCGHCAVTCERCHEHAEGVEALGSASDSSTKEDPETDFESRTAHRHKDSPCLGLAFTLCLVGGFTFGAAVSSMTPPHLYWVPPSAGAVLFLILIVFGDCDRER